MAKKKQYPFDVTLDYEQANAIMMAVLAEAICYAEQDIKDNAEFAGPEAVAFVKAAKVVLDWFKVPK